MLQKLKKQWLLFCYALSFFSRVPVAKSINFSAHPFHLGNVYFPVIGLLYALICFAVFSLSQIFLDINISVILMLLAGLLLTGALHEDGFADSCDGFGGGYNKKQCLMIMKDSQIGCYGVIGLIFLFALKVNLLSQLALQTNVVFFSVISSAAVLSRLSALLLIQTSVYARDDHSSKAQASSQHLPLQYLLLTSLFSIAMLVIFNFTFNAPIPLILSAIACLIVSTYCCRRYFNKKIEGYTGDCLGFLQQLNELLILLISLAWFNVS